MELQFDRRIGLTHFSFHQRSSTCLYIQYKEATCGTFISMIKIPKLVCEPEGSSSATSQLTYNTVPATLLAFSAQKYFGQNSTGAIINKGRPTVSLKSFSRKQNCLRFQLWRSLILSTRQFFLKNFDFRKVRILQHLRIRNSVYLMKLLSY